MLALGFPRLMVGRISTPSGFSSCAFEDPAKRRSVGYQSTTDTGSLMTVPAGICPGQDTQQVLRVPPSYRVPLLPRRWPLFPPSWICPPLALKKNDESLLGKRLFIEGIDDATDLRIER